MFTLWKDLLENCWKNLLEKTVGNLLQRSFGKTYFMHINLRKLFMSGQCSPAL
jgi:hypothetical protein